MKTVRTVLGWLGFLSGAAFLVFWVLAWTGHVPLGEPLAVTSGVMALVVGLFDLRAAVEKTAVSERGKWARSNVKVGRLSTFAQGTFFCAVGTGMLGALWLSDLCAIPIVAIAMASFALGCYGKTLDRGRARGRKAEQAQ